MAITTPDAVPGEVIEASWGDAVRADLIGLQSGTESHTVMRISSGTGADLSSTGHGLQIGPTAGANLVADANEVMARSAGAAADLYLNRLGGVTHTTALEATSRGQVGGDPLTVAGIGQYAEGSIETHVSSPSISSYPNLRCNRSGTANVATARYATFAISGTTVGTITIVNSTTIAYNTTSDPRLKSTVGPITDAAARVRTLGDAAYRGTWNGDESGEEWDLIDATDMATAAPYAVQGEAGAVDDDGNIDPMMVDNSKLVPLLCAAIAELTARIEALEAA